MSNLQKIMPFFIVNDLEESIAFYTKSLGFTVSVKIPDEDAFFAIVNKDSVGVMLKAVGVEPLPNPHRHADAKWDAFVSVEDPKVFAQECNELCGSSYEATISIEGILGFEVVDNSGYVIFFGNPSTEAGSDE